MPAAVLVMMVLGAIAVDSARLFLAQRELGDAAAAAANDVAGAALDEGAFYRSGGELRIDAVRARQVAVAAVAARRPEAAEWEAPDVQIAGRQVCITLRATVTPLFARAIPGAGAPRVVTGRAAATAAGGAEGPGVPIRGLC
jgi:hypothetical protein